MVDLIVACTKSFGIGLQKGLPWNCKEELSIFKNKTNNNIIIVGRRTAETLPKLQDRIVICVSRSGILKRDENQCIVVPSINQGILYAKEHFGDKKIFIAGGSRIYNEILCDNIGCIETMHISIMKDSYICDKNILLDLSKWVIHTKEEYNEFMHYTMTYSRYNEYQYLSLLKEVLKEGEERKGRNGFTKSVFGKNLKFDLRKGFPLLTTKKMFLRGIVEELLFFIKGETDSKLLENKGVNIWKGNTSREFLDSIGKVERKEGIMGPLYGYQWRHFNADYDEENNKPLSIGIDQLQNVVDTIINDPYSRRILLTSYNPIQSNKGVLYPCHSIIIQFYVSEGFLDMYCYNRSQDLFLGVPFNISSSSLLLTLIAKITKLTPRYLTIGMGDVHIYQQHYEAVETQIDRLPYRFPKIEIKDVYSLKDIENLTFQDFKLIDYLHYPIIKSEMIS